MMSPGPGSYGSPGPRAPYGYGYAPGAYYGQ